MIFYIHDNRVWCRTQPTHEHYEEIGTMAFKERIRYEIQWNVTKYGISWTLNLSSEIKLTKEFIQYMEDLSEKLCWAFRNDPSELDYIELDIYHYILELLEEV